METHKYVIVGGGVAGGSACVGIRKVDAKGSIVLVAGERHPPYQRPSLSKGYLMGQEGPDRVLLKEDAYYTQNNINVLCGMRATRLEPGTHSIALDDGRVLGYEKLLLATGGYAWRLPMPGNDLPGVFTLRTIEDADSIRQAARPGMQALVVGGSFIGSEVASSLAQLGLAVTMVFPEARLLERAAPQELGDFLHAKYEANGVRILAGIRPKRLDGDGQVRWVLLENGEPLYKALLEVDLVVMGVGIRLNTELARDAGLEMDEKDAVLVDEYLCTSAPDIYAAGDIAAWPDSTFGKRLRVEHWDVARQQGLRAGRNMAGEQKPYTALPYFFSDLFDLSFEAWGDLTSWDQTVVRGAPGEGRFAIYYFNRAKMVGVLAAGRPAEERKPMQALVEARPAYTKIAARLRDEGTDLGLLIE
jgi:3-phenylpropionate/trans-cinnamate dioxygenase ferredoxin reductase subunit